MLKFASFWGVERIFVKKGENHEKSSTFVSANIYIRIA